MDTKKTGDSEENIIEEEIRKTEIEFKDLLQQRRDLQKVLKTIMNVLDFVMIFS